MEKKQKYRPPQLEQFRSIWLTSNDYKMLRVEKRKQKMSMAMLVHNLITEKYGNQRVLVGSQIEGDGSELF